MISVDGSSYSKPYVRTREFTVLGTVGVCAMTIEQFIKEVLELPVKPLSATVNLVGVPAIISAKKDANIAEMYNQATIAAIDGMPIVKMGKRKGLICERCAAPDIMGPVFLESTKRGKSHYFYGGSNNDILQKLRDNLERDYPGIQIVGMYSPPYRPLTDDEDQRICDEINQLQPNFLWVGIGAPKQELWMQQHQTKITNTIMLGVGAGFNYYAGSLAKAPKWIEKASLEWLYRLIKEPKRLWRRYILGGAKWMYYRIEEKLKGLDN